MAEENHDSDEQMEETTSSSSDDSDSSSTSSSSSSDSEPINEKITLKARKDKHSRGRWKLLSEKNVFRKEWFEKFPWIDENPEDPNMANCRKCNSTMKAHKGILEAHQRSKRHIKNMGGYVEETKKEEKPEKTFASPSSQPPPPPSQPTVGMDHMIDDQISFFTESPADAAHQAVTSLIDKLVEKYHENRLKNLKIQNEAVLQLNVERANFARSENERKLERRLEQEAFKREAQETHLKFLQLQHETKINAMEDERDAKLRAVEQELLFAKQEYEKKVRLLDTQLSNMK